MPPSWRRDAPSLWAASDALDKAIGPEAPKLDARATADAARPGTPASTHELRLALIIPGRNRTEDVFEVLSGWVKSLQLRDDRLNLARSSQPGWTRALCRAMRLVPGYPSEALFEQGEVGDDMFIVLSGSIGIFRAQADRPKKLVDKSEPERSQSSIARSQQRQSMRQSTSRQSTRRRTGLVLDMPGERADVGALSEQYGTLLVTCGANALFGELALLYSQPRAASAVMVESSEVSTALRPRGARRARRARHAALIFSRRLIFPRSPGCARALAYRSS
jgi:CRP-like cAMP-binding protein